MSKKSGQFVVPHQDGWAVRAENASKVTKVFGTKDDAIKRGVETAKKQQVELTILKKDGTIQDKRSYGNDPYPPKG